jgi:hypothetical protein
MYMQIQTDPTQGFVDLTTLTSFQNSSLVVTNTSSYTLYLLASPTQPSANAFGYPVPVGKTVACDQYSTNKIWMRSEGVGPVILSSSAEGFNQLSQVEFGREILAASSTPSAASLRTIAISRSASLIYTSDYYAGFSKRASVASGNTYYYKVTAGASSPLIIESINTICDFVNVTSGKIQHTLEVYAEDSNINDWTYTGGSAVTNIRNMNTGNINKTPTSAFSAGGTGSTTGVADFVFDYTSYEFVSSGSKVQTTQSGLAFFDKDRQIIVPPNKSLLLKSITAGGGAGTIDLVTQFYVSESPAVPTYSGIYA